MSFIPAVFLELAVSVEAVCKAFHVPEHEIPFMVAEAWLNKGWVFIQNHQDMGSVIVTRALQEGRAEVYLGFLTCRGDTPGEAINNMVGMFGMVDSEVVIDVFESPAEMRGDLHGRLH